MSLILILYTYGGYYFLLAVLAKIETKKRIRDENYFPTVSMVVAAYNEEKHIAEKIKNFLTLDYPREKIEFVIGSDGSTDKTDEIVRKYSNQNVKLYSFTRREGKAGVLNKIVPHTRGDILVFSDANTMYSSESIKSMVPYFADPKVGGVCGKLVLINPNQNMASRGEILYWGYENRLKSLEGKIKTVFGATGGIYAIRKSLFQKLPSAKTNISDDFLIPLQAVKLGYDVIYEDKAVATEFASVRMRDEFSRKVRIGSANFYALTQIASLLHPFKGYVSFGLWSHKIIRWLVPFFLVTTLVSNIFIAKTPFYFVFLTLQFVFYFMVFLGWIMMQKGIQSNLLSYIYYFAVVNFALMVGFFKLVMGRQKPSWTRLHR